MSKVTLDNIFQAILEVSEDVKELKTRMGNVENRQAKLESDLQRVELSIKKELRKVH
ncbi:hypothetical protein [Virgibacillus sp. SK37]|uniref:hypothetical protein n=1 Tax=Virgibacillus sp. SK37 TaxID=403957 RepID=UPI0004D11808|nr:hypothetical protein [Virgibacillus sp. SK37]AIF45533.1 hypothetical protein X953_15880 [Virgibacillus sp. SK37]